MTEPLAMISVVFGPLDDSWHAGADDFDVRAVRYWRTPADRSRDMPYRVDRARSTYVSVRAAFESLGLVLEAATPVSLTFRATGRQVRRRLGFEPVAYTGRGIRLDPPRGGAGLGPSAPATGIGKPPWFSVLSSVAGTVLELLPRSVPATRLSRRQLLADLGGGALVAGYAAPPVPTRPVTAAGLESALGLAGAERGAGVRIAVVDSGDEGGGSTTPEAVGELDPLRDEQGHGPAVVAHLRAILPDADVPMLKYTDASGFRNYPRGEPTR